MGPSSNVGLINMINIRSHNVEMEMVLYAYYHNERQYFTSYSTAEARFKWGVLDLTLSFYNQKQSLIVTKYEGTF